MSIIASLVQSILPAISVAVVSLLFQQKNARKIEKLRAQLTHRGGYLARKLKAHEDVWPLVAKCNRAQECLTTAARTGGQDIAPLARDISKARKELKNFVYDKGLYFDEETRTLVQDLDTALANREVTDVRKEIKLVEVKLRREIDSP